MYWAKYIVAMPPRPGSGSSRQRPRAWPGLYGEGVASRDVSGERKTHLLVGASPTAACDSTAASMFE